MHGNELTKPALNNADVFWGEISPCDHLVQIYEDDDIFLDSLEGFVRGGLVAGDGVIIIATPVHLQALRQRLGKSGIDTKIAAEKGEYLTMDAKEALARFMVKEWPDEALFSKLVTTLL